MKEGLGYTIEAAAFVIMLQTVAQLCGVGIGAWIGDRYDKRLASAGCMLGHIGGAAVPHLRGRPPRWSSPTRSCTASPGACAGR